MPIFNTVSSPGLVYHTDFENVTKRDAQTLNMGIGNGFAFEGNGGAAMWMEGLDRITPGITCHSGSRCVGMELTDIMKSRRNEFNIINFQNLIQNELFVSVWLYLPADWRLHAPSNNDRWYELVNPYFTGGHSNLPYGAVHIVQDSNVTVFDIDFDLRDVSGTLLTIKEITNYQLPLGRWFNLQYYVLRNETYGIMKVWIDRVLLWDGRHLSTKNPLVASWFTTIAKIYYSTTDTFSPYRIWVDDLEVYNAEPAPSIPGFPWESILVGAIVGLGALAVVRRRRNSASSQRFLLITSRHSSLTVAGV